MLVVTIGHKERGYKNFSEKVFMKTKWYIAFVCLLFEKKIICISFKILQLP